jgi:hypothetical protein
METAIPRGQKTAEHYVTRFDHRFLLQGLALYVSLQQQQPESVLWVLCLDQEAENQLRDLNLPHLQALSLRSLETPALLQAKGNRSRVEYIYTLTPFMFDFVFDRDSSIKRVTYVDTDLFFFKPPAVLAAGMEAAGRQILITEHDFAPEYSSRLASSGRFCVQFLIVTRDEAARRIIRRWQEQCLESCSASTRQRDQVFGDQKYLEDWPEQYPEIVFVSPQYAEMQAPWNVDHHQRQAGETYWPIFYHFHSFRIFHPRWVELCAGYNIKGAGHLYRAYLESLGQQAAGLKARGIPAPYFPFRNMGLVRLVWRFMGRRTRIGRLVY